MKNNQPAYLSSYTLRIKFLCAIFCVITLNLFSQTTINVQGRYHQPDSVAIVYADTNKIFEIGTIEYYDEYNRQQDTTKRPYKIGYYKNGTDTAFYFNGMKIGYVVEINRGDEIHPQWISLGTFPRGYTFGASYHYYEKKHSYFEAYAGIFGMLYPNIIKMFSVGANYTRFFCKKEKPKNIYQSVLVNENKRYTVPTLYKYETRIKIIKNIHWGFQVGFSYDNVNGERASFYFNSNNQSFQLLQARSLAGVAGLTRFVSKAAQLSFGKNRQHVLRGANFRRLSFVMAYYPLMELEHQFISAQEGTTPNPDADPYDDFYAKPFGWKIVWDGRIAFWSKRSWGIVYRYGIEQTPFRQYGRNGLVPIIAGGLFFNIGENPSIKSGDWMKL